MTLHQGIIKCLKSHYRKQLLRKVITKVDQHQEASEIAKGINVYDACVWIAHGQKCISQETVQKCFMKCDLSVTRIWIVLYQNSVHVQKCFMKCDLSVTRIWIVLYQNSVHLTLNCQVYFLWLPTH